MGLFDKLKDQAFIMRKIFYLFVTLWALVLISCSSNAPKEITPTSTDFTSGGLAKLIEVVDEPCQLSYVEKDGVVETQYIILKVKLKLTKESPELQNIDARNIDFGGLLSVATINLVDENEIKIQDLKVKVEDWLKLKKLLQGKVGDEETITFEGEFHNSKDAPKWFNQAVAFTPFLTGDLTCSQAGFSDGAYCYDGTWESPKYSSQSCRINFVKNGNVLSDCSYTNLKYNATIPLSGTFSENQFDFEGKINGKKFTIHLNGDGDNTNKLEGTGFDEAHNDNARIVLKKVDGIVPDMSSDTDDEDDNSEYDNNSSSSAGSVDFEELLDSYDKYVTEYISFMKKASEGDMSALTEYPKMMERANDLSEKIEKCKGEMSVSQLERYNKITMRMAEAAKQMQKKH